MTGNENGSTGRINLLSNTRWVNDAIRLRTPHSHALASVGLSLNRELIAPMKFSQEAMYFPLGFPLRILSNSAAIHAAAAKSWGYFRQAFPHRPLEMRIDLKEDVAGADALPPEPVHSVRGHLFVYAADINNFTIADLKEGRAVGCVTRATVASPNYLRYYMLEATALVMVATQRAVALHGACVRVQDRGILLCGDSGAGKSTLAYAGARSGWTFVCDDACYLPFEREDRMVVGNCHQVRFRPSACTLFPEIEGFPITPRATGKPSVEVSTSEWPELATADAASVDHIVFLNRSPGPCQELVPVPRASAWPWFRQHVMATSGSRPLQEGALSRLLKAEVFELRYQEMNWAIDRINQLATSGQ